MNADSFKYKEITDIILRSFYEVYNELGDEFMLRDRSALPVCKLAEYLIQNSMFDVHLLSPPEGR